jgi:hypothetical protein
MQRPALGVAPQFSISFASGHIKDITSSTPYPGPMKQFRRKCIAYCTDVCERTVSVALHSGPISGNGSRCSDFFMVRPDPFRGPWTLLDSVHLYMVTRYVLTSMVTGLTQRGSLLLYGWFRLHNSQIFLHAFNMSHYAITEPRNQATSRQKNGHTTRFEGAMLFTLYCSLNLQRVAMQQQRSQATERQ